MIQTAIVSFLTASVIGASAVLSLPQTMPVAQIEQAQVELGSTSMSLDNRIEYKPTNDIYKDNILLNLAYLSGTIKKGDQINWEEVRKPLEIQFSLEPGERFAYHDSLLLEYSEGVVLTTNSQFNAEEGYKYSEGLYGMGICHLASVIHWAALNAGLESIAPSNHDFAVIREVPKEYGVAIYSSPDASVSSARQNLYIKNTLNSKVTFRFDFDGVNLKVSVLK